MMADVDLHEVGAACLESYLQGALKDGTRAVGHRTHRISQSNRGWLELLQRILAKLGHKAWVYREGQTRDMWVVETSAGFLATDYDARQLMGTVEGIHYARGYFDAEGGMPRRIDSRLYLQLVQKDRQSLATLRGILRAAGIECGALHNPSVRVDPEFWRFYIRARSHRRFMRLVGSWHPIKAELIRGRLSERH
jgi:hypothetical protein